MFSKQSWLNSSRMSDIKETIIGGVARACILSGLTNRLGGRALIKKWVYESNRMALVIKVADRLWFDTRKDGMKNVNLIRIGWVSSPSDSVKIYVLTLPFLSIRLFL